MTGREIEHLPGELFHGSIGCAHQHAAPTEGRERYDRSRVLVGAECGDTEGAIEQLPGLVL